MKAVYGPGVVKAIKKHKLPQDVWEHFRDAFEALALTENFRLFDIKKMVDKKPYKYYRLRIGKYRALFHFEDDGLFVEEIAPRGGIYK